MSGLPPPPLGFQSQQSSGLLPSPAQHQPTTTSRQSPASPANGNTTNIPSSTWATAAMSAPPYAASPPPTPQLTAQANQGVERNRWGQRVDPVVKYDASEVKRIKQHKMCNVHYLRGDCPYDPCTHDHYYKNNKNELAMLRYISRAIPCKWESGCDDAKCIYGHICPHSTDGKKECYWGEKCRFDRELHGIDRTVVKLTKVGAK